MASIVWIGFVAFFIASLAVGIRLIALWRRTREQPELLIGLGVLGIGPVGFGLATVGKVIADDAGNTPVAIALALASALAICGGTVAKCIFNWRVYHRDSGAVRGVVICAALTLAVGLVLRIVVLGGAQPAVSHPLALLQSGVQIGALLWGAYEALRYYGLMRRRRALGLADPVVTNRFLLWGIGAFAAGFGSAVAIVGSLAVGGAAERGTVPWILASSSAHGSIAAVAMWLAFVPPARYVRYILERAGEPSAA